MAQYKIKSYQKGWEKKLFIYIIQFSKFLKETPPGMQKQISLKKPQEVYLSFENTLELNTSQNSSLSHPRLTHTEATPHFFSPHSNSPSNPNPCSPYSSLSATALPILQHKGLT